MRKNNKRIFGVLLLFAVIAVVLYIKSTYLSFGVPVLTGWQAFCVDELNATVVGTVGQITGPCPTGSAQYFPSVLSGLSEVPTGSSYNLYDWSGRTFYQQLGYNKSVIGVELFTVADFPEYYWSTSSHTWASTGYTDAYSTSFWLYFPIPGSRNLSDYELAYELNNASWNSVTGNPVNGYVGLLKNGTYFDENQMDACIYYPNCPELYVPTQAYNYYEAAQSSIKSEMQALQPPQTLQPPPANATASSANTISGTTPPPASSNSEFFNNIVESIQNAVRNFVNSILKILNIR